MEENVYYVGVKKPEEIKKLLLEVTKDILVCLQKYEESKINSLRLERESEYLRGKITEVSLLLNKLKETIPKVKSSIVIDAEEEVKEEKPKKKSKDIGQIEKIEQALEMIEEKINRL